MLLKTSSYLSLLACASLLALCIGCGGGGGGGTADPTLKATLSGVILPSSVPSGSILVGSPQGHTMVAVTGTHVAIPGSAGAYTLPAGGTPVAVEGPRASAVLLYTTIDGANTTHLWVAPADPAAPFELGTGLLALSANGVSAVTTGTNGPEHYNFIDRLQNLLSSTPFHDHSFSFGVFGILANLPISVSDRGAVLATDSAGHPATYAEGAFSEGDFTGATCITSIDSEGLTPNVAGVDNQEAAIYHQVDVFSNWLPVPMQDLYGSTSTVLAGGGQIFLGQADHSGQSRWIVWLAAGFSSHAFDITDQLSASGIQITSVVGGGSLLTSQGFPVDVNAAEFVYKDSGDRIGCFRVTVQ